MMDNEIIEAMNDYYKLKQQYDNTVISQKNKILKNDTLSSKDKRRRFKQLVYKCINCKKNGGTIFTNTNGYLKAICGSDTPCKLDIEIMKGKYTDLRVLNREMIEQTDYLKIDIIRTKLMFLFNLMSEETSIDDFENLRNELSFISKKNYDALIRYNNIFNNKNKENELRKNTLQLAYEVNKIKEIYNLYLENNKEQNLKEMVDIYVSVIKPIEEKIRDLKYVEEYIQEDEKNNISELITKTYTISDLEVEIPVYETSKGEKLGNKQNIGVIKNKK